MYNYNSWGEDRLDQELNSLRTRLENLVENKQRAAQNLADAEDEIDRINERIERIEDLLLVD